MPRRNMSPYWLDQAIDLRKDGDTLAEIANVLLIPVSTIRYQLSLNLPREEYDSYCKEPNSADGRQRTKAIFGLHEDGLNGNQIAKLVGVSRQYVYKLIRMKREQEDALLDYEVEKQVIKDRRNNHA